MLAQIINFMNFGLDDLFLRLKTLSIILSLVFGAIFIYFFILIKKLIEAKMAILRAPYQNIKSAGGGAVQSRWEEIIRHARSDREAEWKLAVIEADKLVDDLLKLAGYQGETMGERLMSVEPGQFQNLNGLWEAHKIRNKLVHETGYFLRHAEAQRALQMYERALKELQGI